MAHEEKKIEELRQAADKARVVLENIEKRDQEYGLQAIRKQISPA